MLLPALGELVIPARMRLSFALVFSLVLYPLIAPSLPPMPEQMMDMIALLLHESLVGLILGGITRLIDDGDAGCRLGDCLPDRAVDRPGCRSHQWRHPGRHDRQFPVSILGVTLIFATDLHHVALSAIHDSYMIFSPTDPLMFDDAAELAIQVGCQRPSLSACRCRRRSSCSGWCSTSAWAFSAG